jgi:anaerobic selenocysteine-containing dehydrogenase
MMTQEQSPANGRVSRRDFLFVAAAGGGALLGAGMVASPAKAAKMSPKAMQYRPSPNGNQRCDNCANFLAPSSCKVVDGAISPSGWCILYRAK